MPISKETANKLLQGEFKTFEDLLAFQSNLVDDFNKDITILYRTMENENKETFVDIIETLFFNE